MASGFPAALPLVSSLVSNSTESITVTTSSYMSSLSTSDYIVIVLGVVLGGLYLFKEQIFGAQNQDAFASKVGSAASALTEDSGDARDFVSKMKAAGKRIAIIYGSQTGTAEDYAVRLAKEAKSRFGISSLVCDAEEYDYENLDDVPEDSCVFFVVATYGEGEPTDNAVNMLQSITDSDFPYSKGKHDLSGLKYVVFALGNRTYEHFNKVGRDVDAGLAKAGAKRIGERGEGDDDKSMEEDYLAWKDGMWAAFSETMGVEEGAGADSADFVVNELSTFEQSKVYLGELSTRALTKVKGIHDAKNPFAAPVAEIKELFQDTTDRNCVHVEFSIEGSGMTYQHGDHVGLWPSNNDIEVDRLLLVLGLYGKKDAVIGVDSLDPQLAKVPFPVPTTYGTVLRHYIDISAVAGRQAMIAFAKFAPNPEAAKYLTELGSDKELYNTKVYQACLKLGEVLQLAAGNPIHEVPTLKNTTAWSIPFDVIISAIPRLQARYYSISSSPKVHPNTLHVTAVVLKYENVVPKDEQTKWVFGVGSNYLLNLKAAAKGETIGVLANGAASNGSTAKVALPVTPSYDIKGPRDLYFGGSTSYKAPIHVRRSTFRLPTNPKIPVVMIGPGTGVAPFRGFVQERVALARKALEKSGENALDTWGQIKLYYGCRSDKEDWLYRDEWPEYQSELKGKFDMRIAFSRSGARKPDGSKIYVQDLIWEDRELLKKLIFEQKGYVYICGDAKSMSKAVEDALAKLLGEALGKDYAAGQAEVKAMKARNRLLSDVWS